MNEIFARRFRIACASADISYAEMARRCGVSRQAVKQWRFGRSYPTSANLIVICEETGVSMEWLMWPLDVDLKSTPYAPNGVHIKDMIRLVIEEMLPLAETKKRRRF